MPHPNIPHPPKHHQAQSHLALRTLRLLVFASLAALLFSGAYGCAPVHIPDPSAENLPSSRGKNPVVAAARSLAGVRYKWGGDNPQEGFDCSGLTWWTYRQVGVELPRVSWEQFESGAPVNRREIQPGDLVFFRLPGGKKNMHVGIATERGTFIHSPRKGGKVREEPMDATYWRENFLGARRYLRSNS